MKFRLISDLHLDFSQYVVPEMPDDIETVLLIAGDICEGRYLTILENFLDNHSHRFHSIVFVLGNHDYYGTNLYTHPEKVYKEIYSNHRNVYFLDNKTLEIAPDIVIVGSTLWTDYEKGDPAAMIAASNCMADFMWITVDDCGYTPERITTHLIYSEHMRSKAWIRANIKKYKNLGKKVIVLSHHAPTWKSVGDGFEGDKLNGAFVSDLSDLILDTVPDFWCHGHTHSFRDYMVGDDTRVLCNPRGYHSSRSKYGERTNWNPELIFEL